MAYSQNKISTLDAKKIRISQDYQKSGNRTERNSLNDRYFDNNQGRFISCQAGGKLISMCFHQTKQHSATCEVHNNFTKNFGVGDKVVRSAKSEAPPGRWAIAYCDSGRLGGDKTFYNCW